MIATVIQMIRPVPLRLSGGANTMMNIPAMGIVLASIQVRLRP